MVNNLKRSLLYPLIPEGLGSANVESLSSYINRLSKVHCITNTLLINRLVYPRYQKKIKEHYPSFKTCYIFGSSSLNTGKMGGIFSDIFSELTAHQSISELTLVEYQDLLHSNSLRRNKQWCPECYKEMRDFGGVIYDKKIWTFRCLKFCPEHNCCLMDKCPYCKTTVNDLTRYIFNGYCNNCEEFLGDLSHCVRYTVEDLQWEVWKYNQLSDFIRTTSKMIPSKCEISERILQINNYMKCLGVKKKDLAAALSISESTFYWWVNRGMTLENLLKYCYIFRMPLLQFFEQNTKPNLYYEDINISSPKVIINHKQTREELCVTLDRMLEENIYPPLSSKEIHRKLGYKSDSSLYYIFPEKIRVLSERYKKYKFEQTRKNYYKNKRIIENSIQQLVEAGIRPSKKRVNSLLGKRLVQKQYNDVYYNALRKYYKNLYFNKH